jgi:opacity protein-like surface antigen
MVSVKNLIPAAAAALLSTAAYAADMPQPYQYQPPPQPQVIYQPQPAVIAAPAGNWYLRGDIGVGTNNFTLTYLENPLNSDNFAFNHSSMADTLFIGGGVGYEMNNWLRFDLTAEYRSKTQVNAFGQYTFGGGTFGDQYQGYLKSLVVLGNAYADLGTWWCLTPFVGVGIGEANNTMADLVDLGIGTSGAGIGRNSSSWNPAWALYAGVAYNVTQNFKVELAYRYLNYGSITDTVDCIGGCNPDSYKWSNLTSQDLMLGVRWLLQPDPQPVMMQQPQPALSTRG